jgi:hypothetical protein
VTARAWMGWFFIGNVRVFRVQPHVPCFGTHVQLNVMGLSLDKLAVTRYLRHSGETPFVGGG